MASEARCKSCGRIMLSPRDHGTAADGTLEDQYCSRCYRSGQFTSRPVSHDDAVGRVEHYMSHEMRVPSGEAHARAQHLLLALGGWAPGMVRAAHEIVGHWWSFALRGVLAILFGILMLARPGPALAAFVVVFGIWAFVDGVFSLFAGIFGRAGWQLGLVGILGIAVGLLTFFRPGLTAIAIYAAVAVWCIGRGLLEIGLAIQLRKVIAGEFWLVLGGISSIAIGVLMIVLPEVGFLTLAWLIGLYAVEIGALLLALAFRLRGLHAGERKKAPPTLAPQAPQPQPG